MYRWIYVCIRATECVSVNVPRLFAVAGVGAANSTRTALFYIIAVCLCTHQQYMNGLTQAYVNFTDILRQWVS